MCVQAAAWVLVAKHARPVTAPASGIIRQAHIAHLVIATLTATVNMVVVAGAAAAVVVARLRVDALIGPLTEATENVNGTLELHRNVNTKFVLAVVQSANQETNHTRRVVIDRVQRSAVVAT